MFESRHHASSRRRHRADHRPRRLWVACGVRTRSYADAGGADRHPVPDNDADSDPTNTGSDADTDARPDAFLGDGRKVLPSARGV